MMEPPMEHSKEVNPENKEEIEVEDISEPSDEWLDVLGSGSLKKKVVRPGIVDSRPMKGDTVIISATGKMENGKEVDKHSQLTFTVGDGEVIVGLDMIVPLMDKGEVAEVYIDSRFAFGSKGLPPALPGDTSVIYTVELLDFAPEESPSDISIEKRKLVGNRKRVRGNWWFNREDYSLAIQCYNAAIDFLDDDAEEYGDEVKPDVQHILEERLKALNNMGAAQLKIEAYEVALRSFDAVLRCQPNNVKALFRKGKVLGCQGKFKESIIELKRAMELEPEARPIHQELARIRERARIEAESEKGLYRRMLGLKKEYSQADRKHPVIKSFPFKTWSMIFFSLLAALIAYKYKEEALQVFQ